MTEVGPAMRNHCTDPPKDPVDPDQIGSFFLAQTFSEHQTQNLFWRKLF
jgi:hypothetical protein